MTDSGFPLASLEGSSIASQPRQRAGNRPEIRTKLKNEKDLVLSDRERQVLIFAAFGYNQEETAKSLFLSKHTINDHRKHLFRKLNATNTAHALTEALLRREITIELLSDIKDGIIKI